ncbi:zinc finger CCCH domain-containing protein 29 [Tripterygium wilfordii]|uniref:Zinc finger CCCH domain-containing protein 29 n=2 Tax=Tripterygium wilfordii TaxID=458696 RepID=A0A7J7E1U7_TRIWF|nr:zinc finger CCCH domain-containing protein 29-like isoform X2 [Tripterygium wilfordii]KAF5752578.1 zinc finger CCCH domain-containing protein 29 [Tripterygium wilfordii]
MCSDSKSKHSPASFGMEGEYLKRKDGAFFSCSVLLELAASDDLAGFKDKVEEKGFGVEEASLWYGRRVGSKTMGFEERTPLMIAAMFGSIDVLKYLIETGMVDVNKACGSERVTALHCAIAGGADVAVEIVKFLLDASANPNYVDANGNMPCDLITPTFKSIRSSTKRALEMLLKGEHFNQDGEEKLTTMPQLLKVGSDKKEYPIDVSLPDINNGLYGTDEFRMYSFKVKPCSRAYSHDWTECPFVHPGENARRRDPKKYLYLCVPCPDFRKGACQKGDACEYAHGVFESWLHPAQYRTRLCKDETGCNRKVCFFAHKPEELRPVYASTGSAMPSPRSTTVSAVDMATLSPLTLGSASLSLPSVSTPQMSPLAAGSQSPKSGGLRQNKINLTPPALQLPGSRLKSALSARDFQLEMELLALENHNSLLQQQHMIDEISALSSPSWSKDFNRMGDLKATNLEDVFGSLDPSVLSSLPGISLKTSRPSTPTQVQSPTGFQMHQNMNQLRASHPATNLSSSPNWKPTARGFDSSAAMAAAVMNSRSSAFAKRSQSFIDRGAATNRLGHTAAVNSAAMMPSNKSGWTSPDGRLDWGIQGDELNKLRKSASFGIRTRNASTTATADFRASPVYEPDVSWVNPLVKDVNPERQQYNLEDGVRDSIPPWMEQLYMEQEQMVA